jgi:hypothetical protein
VLDIKYLSLRRLPGCALPSRGNISVVPLWNDALIEKGISRELPGSVSDFLPRGKSIGKQPRDARRGLLELRIRAGAHEDFGKIVGIHGLPTWQKRKDMSHGGTLGEQAKIDAVLVQQSVGI